MLIYNHGFIKAHQADIEKNIDCLTNSKSERKRQSPKHKTFILRDSLVKHE